MSTLPAVGTRIRLVSTADTYTKLKSGDEGTVTGTDALGSLQVQWDSGSSLSLLPGDDEFEVI